MKKTFYIFMLLAALGISSCSYFAANDKSGEPNKEAPASSPSDAEPKPAVETENVEPKSKDAKATREQIEAKDAAETGLGPTDTLRAFNDAVIKKDAAKIRSFLSRDSIKLIEDSAKEQGRAADDILTAEDGAPLPVEREMQNEKIDGDNATVEVKNSMLGNYDKMFLVKENGNWRVAMDKFRDEMLRKINEMQKNPPKPSTK